MEKIKTKYVCQSCGYESAKWMGRCPGCNEWNTLVEEFVEEKKAKRGAAFVHSASAKLKPERLANVVSQEETRVHTNSREFDRVLGGGIVPGSLVLVGGDPGIGKSTILLQVSAHLAHSEEKCSTSQGKNRSNKRNFVPNVSASRRKTYSSSQRPTC